LFALAIRRAALGRDSARRGLGDEFEVEAREAEEEVGGAADAGGGRFVAGAGVGGGGIAAVGGAVVGIVDDEGDGLNRGGEVEGGDDAGAEGRGGG